MGADCARISSRTSKIAFWTAGAVCGDPDLEQFAETGELVLP